MCGRTHKNCSQFLPFVKELDELCQTGLSTKALTSQLKYLTEMQKEVPGDYGELCVTYQLQPQLKATSLCEKAMFLK